MYIQRNLARSLQRAIATRRMTMEALSEEIGVSKTALIEYTRGRGNPRADTIELLVEKLDLPPSELVAGIPSGVGAAETVLRAAEVVSGLPRERQENVGRLFRELVELLSLDNE